MESQWSLLPHDILRLIIKSLDTIDYHCISAVCQNYRLCCKTDLRRFIPTDQVPWLYNIRRSSETSLVGLYRPLTDKTYTLDIPQICKTYCYYAKDGWLLLREYDDHRNLFVFNIFSRQKVVLPSLAPNMEWGHKVAFSTHQKEPSRVVVIIHGSAEFSSVYAWTKGDTTWKRRDFCQGVQSIAYPLLSDDLLYCFTTGVYNFMEDLKLRTGPLMITEGGGKIITETLDVTSNIALCNNNLYFYWKDLFGVYKFDCGTMQWSATDDARNTIWFLNTGSCGGGGFMIKGNLTNTESVLRNLVNKGCKIEMNEFKSIKKRFYWFEDYEQGAKITDGTFRVIRTMVEDGVEWNWMNVE